jgi:hypothetical protein
MTNLHSEIAYWVGQFNASQASLVTRTSERDAARNGLYVSGTYLSGPTWQAQDTADAAALVAALTPASQVIGNISNSGTFTIPISGEWILAPHCIVATGTSSSISVTISGSSGFNGVALSVNYPVPGPGAGTGTEGDHWEGFISAGAVITVALAGPSPCSTQCYFIPTRANPH